MHLRRVQQVGVPSTRGDGAVIAVIGVGYSVARRVRVMDRNTRQCAHVLCFYVPTTER